MPARIAELIPEARHVYLVRDPIERIRAHYVHDVSSVGEERRCLSCLADLDDPMNPYVVGSSYATQLERYRRHFPTERILVVVRPRAPRTTAARTLARDLAFLGVDPDFTDPGFDEELNVGSTKREYASFYARPETRASAGLAPVDATSGCGARCQARPPGQLAARRAPQDRRRAPRRRDPQAGPEVERLRESTGKKFESWSV